MKTIFRNMPYVAFLALLGLIYIANAHYAEKHMRQIERLEDKYDEQHWRYMSVKADLMYESLQSQVAKEVAAIGLVSGKPASQHIIDVSGSRKISHE